MHEARSGADILHKSLAHTLAQLPAHHFGLALDRGPCRGVGDVIIVAARGVGIHVAVLVVEGVVLLRLEEARLPLTIFASADKPTKGPHLDVHGRVASIATAAITALATMETAALATSPIDMAKRVAMATLTTAAGTAPALTTTTAIAATIATATTADYEYDDDDNT